MSIKIQSREIVLIEFIAEDKSACDAADALHRIGRDLQSPPGRMRTYRAIAEPRFTTYLDDPSSNLPLEQVTAAVQAALAPLARGEIEVSRLASVHVYPGASPEAVAQFHYVVRTDVVPGHEEELERWYDEEHMPALAAVPGAVLAQRLVSLDAPPRFYACYDLVSAEVLQSSAWLAVRGTDWSSRVRPKFRNTRRIVSRCLVEASALQRTTS